MINELEKIRTIAIYLPQYHPIEENNKWWGTGFTEWTNVAKARPLFEGHYQPHIPADLGFYDLRLDSSRIQQAELAKLYGVSGFCYYHYWFNGKELLDTPIKRLLETKKPNFPFCICWANENWTRRWDGNDDEILMPQNHNHEDDREFIKSLIPYFNDERYISINGKPILIIYRTELFPNIKETSEIWREEIEKAGFKGIYLVRVEGFVKDVVPSSIGFDASMEFAPDFHVVGQNLNEGHKFSENTNVFDYELMMNNMIEREKPEYKMFRCVTPSWDNTARKGQNSTLLINSSPINYKWWLSKMIEYTKENFNADERLLFINAWNEWGEGNHLEPDLENKTSYLEMTKEAINAERETDFNLEYVEKLIIEEKIEEAKMIIVKLLEKDGSNIDLLNNLSIVFILELKFVNAFKVIAKVLSLESNNKIALENSRYLKDYLNKPNFCQKNYALVDEKNFNAAHDENSDKMELSNSLSINWNIMNIDQIKSIDLKDNTMPVRNLGEVVSKQKKEIEINKLIKIAEELIENEKLFEAKAKLEEILEIENNNIDALNNLGVVSILLNEFEEAICFIKKVLSLEPENQVALGNYEYLIENNINKETIELPPLEISRFKNFSEFTEYNNMMQEAYKERNNYEMGLIKPQELFSVTGFCNTCNTIVDFQVDFWNGYETNLGKIPNWRERLVCPKCNLNNRMRLSLHIIKDQLPEIKESKIYIAEQTTQTFQKLKQMAREVIGSEFLGEDYPRGQVNEKGIRNEDFTNLTFMENEFDMVLSFDVFEHIPDFKAAFSESYRVLKESGRLIFSVPFDRNSEQNIMRAKITDTGIQHILPAEYHGDPLNITEGCLCFYHFGWEMLKDLSEVGFSDPQAMFCYSKEYGYLGGDQIIFIATK